MASSSTQHSELARRYAQALFELAEDQGELDTVAGDLGSLAQMVADSADLRWVLESPVLSRERQNKAVRAVADQAGAHEITRNFLAVLARNRRLAELPAIARAYLAELAERRGEVVAEVTVARELGEKQQAALEDALKSRLGGKVAIRQTVDAGLIGGLVVRVGSKMVDASVKTKLDRLKLAMKGVG